MQKREGRSFAAPPPPPPQPDPGRTGRRRWERPDSPRPAAPARVLLPVLDTAVPDVEPPESLTALDRLALLSQAARRDLAAGLVEVAQ